MTLGSQIKTCSDGFEDIKNRLFFVETSFHQNLKDLKVEYEVSLSYIFSMFFLDLVYYFW